VSWTNLVIAVVALLVSLVAFIFSWDAGRRADFLSRLEWMQTLRNALRDMSADPETDVDYEGRRVWMRTCVSLSAPTVAPLLCRCQTRSRTDRWRSLGRKGLNFAIKRVGRSILL
jgi:hypothetical protein